MMQKTTLLVLLTLLAAGCASTPKNQSLDDAARLKSDNYLHQAIAEFRSGNMAKASEAAEKSITLNPANGLAYNLRALTRERLGQLESASHDFQKAMELAPNDPTVRNNFGTLLCSRKKYREAEQNFLFAAGINSNTEPEVAYTNAGLCAKREGNPEKARKYFNQALSHNAGQPSALYQLASMELENGNPVGANTYLTQYRRYAPHTAKSLYLGARIEHSLGNTQGVEEYISQLQSQFPDSTEIKQARLLINATTGRLAAGNTPKAPRQKTFAPGKKPSASVNTASRPAPATFSKKAKIRVYNENWILSQPRGNYTLQIMASENPAEITKLIKAKISPDDLARFSFTRFGKRWHNLIMGSYTSNEQAQAALDSLPVQMKKLSPWIRPISSVQRVIKAEAVKTQKKP